MRPDVVTTATRSVVPTTARSSRTHAQEGTAGFIPRGLALQGLLANDWGVSGGVLDSVFATGDA